MSRHGTLLYISPGSALDLLVRCYIREWERGSVRWPNRSDWLTGLEAVLREAFPTASSADLTLTARQLAPFPLKAGHAVP